MGLQASLYDMTDGMDWAGNGDDDDDDDSDLKFYVRFLVIFFSAAEITSTITPCTYDTRL